MTVIELHPEQLLDAERAGSLSTAQRPQLAAHLAGCPECRLLRQAQRDFETERETMDPPILSLLPQVIGTLKQQAPAEKKDGRPTTRTARRVLLVAAIILAASSAAAATGWLGGWWSAGGSESQEQTAPMVPTVNLAPASNVTAPPVTTTTLTPTTSTASSAESSPPEPASSAAQHNAARPSAEQLFTAASNARRAGRYQRAIRLYRHLQRRYPKSTQAHASRTILARLLLDRGRADEALTGFDRYLKRDPASLTEEAMVGRALAFERLGKPAEERAAWRALLQRYSGSIHAGRAKARLAALNKP